MGGGPHVGNNCILGAGSALVGDITIGDNVKVGTNCVVNFDVPDNSTVVVQKARIIKKIK